ncbi:MAG: AraC family transcriptional regulator [Lachnospiraceae bacterium]
MKLEKNAYEDDFPINISVMEISQYPSHYQKDLEIIYVLKGEIKFRNGPFDYLLHEGDVFTNNMYEVHSIYKTSQENLIASIKISSAFFTRFFPNLNKSTFMFYSNKESQSTQENLKYMLLNLIYTYLKKGYNHKSQCINQTLHIIKYLGEHFDVFRFEEKGLAKFDSDNPIIINRIHNIINYMYDYHADNITLDDLSRIEHLSTFYISHLIKQFTGVSFKEFLYFIRVEWSEVYLLDDKRKINTIAKDVGFSTTAYYEKYFTKWFGCSPEEYRGKNVNCIKSPINPEKVRISPNNEAIKLIANLLSSANSNEQSSRYVNNTVVNIEVDTKIEVIKKMDFSIELVVTLQDYEILGNGIFDYTGKINCKNIILLKYSNDSLNDILNLKEVLLEHSLEVDIIESHSTETATFGFDSIAAFYYVLEKNILNKEKLLRVPLRDQGDASRMLKGNLALYTASGIPKSTFYAYLLLSKIRGDLISNGKNYSVIRLLTEPSSYLILAYNYDESITTLCSKQSTLYETKAVIDDFLDELTISIKIDLLEGKYFGSKYTFEHDNNIFAFMSKINFPEKLRLKNETALDICTTPEIDVFSTYVEDSINLDFSFRGVGVQIVLIQKMEDK